MERPLITDLIYNEQAVAFLVINRILKSFCARTHIRARARYVCVRACVVLQVEICYSLFNGPGRMDEAQNSSEFYNPPPPSPPPLNLTVGEGGGYSKFSSKGLIYIGCEGTMFE